VPLFLRRHRGIKLVCFNGSKAEECWRRHALALSPLPDRRIKYVRLPSTSPAHAAMPYARKLALWSKALASAGK
jgi:G:T/U-mismatch repair DNA glycosylase